MGTAHRRMAPPMHEGHRHLASWRIFRGNPEAHFVHASSMAWLGCPMAACSAGPFRGGRRPGIRRGTGVRPPWGVVSKSRRKYDVAVSALSSSAGGAGGKGACSARRFDLRVCGPTVSCIMCRAVSRSGDVRVVPVDRLHRDSVVCASWLRATDARCRARSNGGTASGPGRAGSKGFTESGIEIADTSCGFGLFGRCET